MTYTLRHVRPDDAQAIFEIFSGMHVVHGTMRLPYIDAEQIPKRIAPEDGKLQLVAEAEAGRVVGFVELISFPALFRHRHAADLNMIAVHEDFQGKGVAKALIGEIVSLADKWLNIHRLSLLAWASNENAIRLYKSFGFVEEGRLRDFVYVDGAYVDAVQMGRIKE